MDFLPFLFFCFLFFFKSLLTYQSFNYTNLNLNHTHIKQFILFIIVLGTPREDIVVPECATHMTMKEPHLVE